LFGTIRPKNARDKLSCGSDRAAFRRRIPDRNRVREGKVSRHRGAEARRTASLSLAQRVKQDRTGPAIEAA